MAYVPDEAIERMYGELSPAAIALYLHYCKRRNRKSGSYSCPADQVLRELSGMKRANYFIAKKELIEKGWVIFQKDNASPIVGFESPENPTLNEPDKVQKTRLESPENPTESPENPTRIHIEEPNILPIPLSTDVDESSSSLQPSRRISRKRNSTTTHERPRSNHELGMAFLRDQIGPFPDGGAQGKSLKWILDHYTIEDVKRFFPDHVAEYRGKNLRPSYSSFAKTIGEMKRLSQPEPAREARKADDCERCSGSDIPGYISDPATRTSRKCDHRERVAPDSNVISINRSEATSNAAA